MMIEHPMIADGVQVHDSANPLRYYDRGNNFDALRFVFASAVIYSHSYPFLRKDNTTEPLYGITGGAMTLGELAVAGFFIVSGYLITASWLRSRSLRDYLHRRVLRIYPGYYVAMALSFFLVAPLAGANLRFLFSPRHVVSIATRSIAFGPYEEYSAFSTNPFPYGVNGSIWTILYEFICYLVLPVLMCVRFRSRPFLVVALMSFVSLLAVYRQANGARWTAPEGVSLLTGTINGWCLTGQYFLAGSSFFLLREYIPLRGMLAVAATIVIVAAAHFGCALLFVAPMCLTYIIMWVAYNPHVTMQKFGKHGDFSYGIYLYAFPIGQLLVRWFGSNLTPLELFALAWPLSIGMGVFSWCLVEKRFLKMRSDRARDILDVGKVSSISGTSVETGSGSNRG